jgi:Flp pilus assembly protein TadB
VRLADIGTGGTSYVAPRPSGLKPFHQSPLERFFLSAGSVLVLVLLAAAIVGWLCWTILTRPRRSVVDRVAEFVGAHRADEAPVEKTAQPRHLARRATSTGARTRMARLDQQFEIGQIGISATFFVVATAAATAVSFILLAAIALPLCVIAILVPLAARSWAQRKVQGVRSDFADQLPETLQLLASALRSGHSLIGALNVVVDGAPDPMKGEFSRVLTDDQLGLPIDQSLRKVADRMKSRDMQQVGLLGELQRTAGGNSAEVLDAVVATVRERAEVRGLVRTLTAQGRMSRWILSFMPVVLGAIMFLGAPDLMKPMLTSGGGQIALVAAAMLAVVGSLWIKKITEIEV